jgi:peptidoglycan hydrolase CwlO-like protein
MGLSIDLIKLNELTLHRSIKVGLAALLAAGLEGRSDLPDIDVASAQRAYDNQQSVVASAKHDLDLEEARIAPLQSAVATAQNNLNQANASVDRAQRDLNAANARLSADQQALNVANNDLITLQGQSRNIIRQIESIDADIARIDNDIRMVDRDIKEIDRRLAHISGDGMWTCAYRDTGSEEHPGGHTANNRHQNEIACCAIGNT